MKPSHLAPVVLLVAAAPAGAETVHDRQIWTNLNVSGTTAGGLAWLAEAQPRFFENAGRLGQIDLRGAAGWRLSPAVTVYVGYVHSILSIEDGKDRNEERPFVQLSWTVGEVEGGTLSSRTRLEHRRRSDGSDVGWRFREMLRYVHPLTSAAKPRALLSVEPFIALNDTDWGANAGLAQFRSFAGLEVPLRGKSTVELGYLNQTINDPGRRIRMNHALSLALFIRP